MVYTIPLALEDFVPVIFAGLGFYLLGQIAAAATQNTRAVAAVGASLIALGGLCKATWKILMASTDSRVDIQWLSQALFFVMAPGFICLATALVSSGRAAAHPEREPRPIPPALLLAGSVVALAAGLSLGGNFAFANKLLLICVVVGSLSCLSMGARRAWKAGHRGPALLICGYMLTTLIMPTFMRLEQSIAVQWMEQGVNSLGSFSLVLGAWLWTQRASAQAATTP